MWSIFKTFFFLGWISFGGPAAHIGYFRQHFVGKLNWLDDNEYAELIALSQFLPGPGSSQVGFAIGYKRGGLAGAIAAFLGFTLPSVLMMLLLAVINHRIIDTSLYQSAVHSLKLFAVVVVADATWGMYKNFCQTRLRAGICIVTAVVLLSAPHITTQLLVLAAAGLIGCRYLTATENKSSSPFRPSYLPLALFFILLLGLPLLARQQPLLAIFNDFYQAGSLVFGGGHVVLPLLQSTIGEQMSQDAFLTGYAAAQAVPGPMFTLATYLGYELTPGSISGALIATLGVFLPGFLLLLGVLKNWQQLAQKPKIAGALSGVNAAVVGLLLAALYQPVFSSAVHSSADIAMILAGAYLIKQLKLPLPATIALFMLIGALR